MFVIAIRQSNGTFLSLKHEFAEYVGFGISLVGLAVRMYTSAYAPLFAAQRDVSRQAPDALTTTGMYSVVRHPLYVGSFLIGLGVTCVLMVWWLPIVYTLLFWLYYRQCMNLEDKLLGEKFDKQYQSWAARTPELLPRFDLWRRPDLPFSCRAMLRREYTSLIVVALGHGSLELAELLLQEHRIIWQLWWAILMIGGLAVYGLFRFVERRTKILDVPGRS
jgi:protein-S-isoprenylcysteine O-methyltransferase Ste14